MSPKKSRQVLAELELYELAHIIVSTETHYTLHHLEGNILRMSPIYDIHNSASQADDVCLPYLLLPPYYFVLRYAFRQSYKLFDVFRGLVSVVENPEWFSSSPIGVTRRAVLRDEVATSARLPPVLGCLPETPISFADWGHVGFRNFCEETVSSSPSITHTWSMGVFPILHCTHEVRLAVADGLILLPPRSATSANMFRLSLTATETFCRRQPNAEVTGCRAWDSEMPANHGFSLPLWSTLLDHLGLSALLMGSVAVNLWTLPDSPLPAQQTTQACNMKRVLNATNADDHVPPKLAGPLAGYEKEIWNSVESCQCDSQYAHPST
ncbi:hypothetical protein R3P38DRAFT_3234304 [Favolaschia claudopus]|uniref:Uncharacterized protein n=1 Tax=Favolaschia claudopus TaxID=2862362 RepID=A0AAV9ZGS4_9AGAR